MSLSLPVLFFVFVCFVFFCCVHGLAIWFREFATDASVFLSLLLVFCVLKIKFVHIVRYISKLCFFFWISHLRHYCLVGRHSTFEPITKSNNNNNKGKTEEETQTHVGSYFLHISLSLSLLFYLFALRTTQKISNFVDYYK